MLQEFRSQRITWDIANRDVHEKIEAHEGDSTGRKLIVQVINDGVIEDLTGCTLSLSTKYKEFMGLDAFTPIDITKGLFEIYYPTEMLSHVGNVSSSLVLVTTESRIESKGFNIIVIKSNVDDGATESDNSFTALTQALVQVNNLETTYAPRLNAVEGSVDSLTDYIGDLTTLTTVEKSNIVGALNEIDTNHKSHLADYASLFTTNADAKNSIYRGKYLGSTVTTEQYTAISSGTFTDLYIGDYWTIGGINWRIAAFNYYRNTGDSLVPGNHITIVPDAQLYAHVMNETNITTGGYVGSDMYINGLEQAKTTIRGIFGSHLIKHRQMHSNATVDGKASGWAWVNSEVDLMSEIMIYGSTVWGESTIGGTGYNIGVGKSQLPLFRLNPRMINTRQSYWLRDVVSAAEFAHVNHGGSAGSVDASHALGVRPAFSIS